MNQNINPQETADEPVINQLPQQEDQQIEQTISLPQKKKSSTVVVLSILLMLALVAAGYFAYMYYQPKNLNLNLEPSPNPEKQAIIPPTSTTDPTEGWKVYDLQNLGITLKIPSNLNPSGELTQSTSHSSISWNDTPYSPFRLSATSLNTTFEGGFSYLNGCVGYEKSGDVYKFVTYVGSTVDMSGDLVEEIINKNNVKYLLVRSDPSLVIEGMPPFGIVEKDYVGAIINTNKEEFPALVIQMKLSDKNTEHLFKQMLSTINYTE